jgi:hypothetical protein
VGDPDVRDSRLSRGEAAQCCERFYDVLFHGHLHSDHQGDIPMTHPTGDAPAAAVSDNDVWINVPYISGQIDPQFYHCVVSTRSPFGAGGPVELEARFNLSAYVRHEIAQALKAHGEIK